MLCQDLKPTVTSEGLGQLYTPVSNNGHRMWDSPSPCLHLMASEVYAVLVWGGEEEVKNGVFKLVMSVSHTLQFISSQCEW